MIASDFLGIIITHVIEIRRLDRIEAKISTTYIMGTPA